MQPSRSGSTDPRQWRPTTSPSGLPRRELRSVVTILIGLNLIIHGLDRMLFHWGMAYPVLDQQSVQVVIDGKPMFSPVLRHWGHFSAATLFDGQVWRLLSFQFLHAHIPHLIFNMIALYFFGPMVEAYWGRARFLAFYLLCGIAGAVAYMALWGTGTVVTTAVTPLVGASAGIFGLLIAAAVIAPNTRVMLLIPPIPMKLRTLVLAVVGIGIYTVLFRGDDPYSNAGGEAAHLGGAALGYMLIRNPKLLGRSRFRRVSP